MASDTAKVASAGRAALEALTTAALLLPGLSSQAQAQPMEGVAVQFSRYREAARPIDGVPLTLAPLSADSIMVKATPRLPNGDGLTLTLTQDTWSGATPVSAAPRSAMGNRPIATNGPMGLVIVGASPMLTGSLVLDRSGVPVTIDGAGRVQRDRSVVHTLSSASPETRQQLDAKWLHRIEGGAFGFGGGVSEERDFRSRHVNLERRFDLDDSLTTLTFGISGTRSDIAATLDHDAAPYVTKTNQADRIEPRGGLQVLRGQRNDGALSAGLVQVLGRQTMLEARIAHTRQRGDLSDPYRATSVIFATPRPGTDLLDGNLQSLLEQRPAERRQWTVDGKLIMYVAPADAALHVGYGRYHDDWGIGSHRLEAEWFQPLAPRTLLSVRVSRYVQSAATFYTPYVVSQQPFRQVSIGADGQPLIRNFDPALLPAYFSSDRRLAAFGINGVGVGLSKALTRTLNLEAGIERTRHSGALGAASAFRYTTAQAGLSVAFDETAFAGAQPASQGLAEHVGHDEANTHSHADFTVPPGEQAAHALDRAGAWMMGYRLVNVRDARPIRRGTTEVGDDELAQSACATNPCATRPLSMGMTMHMLELGWGLTDRLSLMLMPQYASMHMETRLLEGQGPFDPATHFGRHESGGWGDTQLRLIATLLEMPQQRWQVGFGVSAPTGDTGLRHRRTHQQVPGTMDYTMQTGSGTWDLLPSVSWLGRAEPWGWGVSLSAVRRLGKNDEGYALGNRWELGGWISRRISPTLAVTLRGVHGLESPIRGAQGGLPAAESPADNAANHGGRLDEVGLGLVADRLQGALRGTSIGLEWLLPVRQDVRGYQLGRTGSLALTWRHHF